MKTLTSLTDHGYTRWAWFIKALQIILLISLYSCSTILGEDLVECEGGCREGLRCVSGVCQPILCTTNENCAVDAICYEGRCIKSCDGRAPCTSGECNDGLCIGSMECRSGELQSCQTQCGEGVQRCVDYQWTTCSVGQPDVIDHCGDGLDNDCDGQPDEGCPSCEDASIRPCENECGVGEQNCVDGGWAPCSVNPPDATGVCPCQEGSTERCEAPCGVGQRLCEGGVLGPCQVDGQVCECATGTVEECDLMCGPGIRACEDGQWSACQGPQPERERCGNGIDDDCDQAVDEGCMSCIARPLGQNNFLGSISASHQSVPLATSSSTNQSWVAWYAGEPTRSGYTQGVSLDGNRVVKSYRVTLPQSSVQDLTYLDGGGLVHLGFTNQRNLHLNFISNGEVSSSATFNSPDIIWEGQVMGGALTQYVVYRGDDLYLQVVERTDPGSSPPRLRLSSRINHLGYDAVHGGGRIAVIYSDDTDDYPEGRVLTLIRASDQGDRVLSEAPIRHPLTGEFLFTRDPSQIIFKANQYLVVFMTHQDQRSHFYSLLLTSEGEVIGGPHLIYRGPVGPRAIGLNLATNDQHRALVWFENSTGEDETQIKYLRLTPDGRSDTDVRLIAEGNLRLFPDVGFNLSGNVVISWVQTDVDPEFGQVFYTIRIDEFDLSPGCW